MLPSVDFKGGLIFFLQKKTPRKGFFDFSRAFFAPDKNTQYGVGGENFIPRVKVMIEIFTVIICTLYLELV